MVSQLDIADMQFDLTIIYLGSANIGAAYNSKNEHALCTKGPSTLLEYLDPIQNCLQIVIRWRFT